MCALFSQTFLQGCTLRPIYSPSRGFYNKEPRKNLHPRLGITPMPLLHLVRYEWLMVRRLLIGQATNDGVEGGTMCKTSCYAWNKRNERRNLGGVSTRSRNSATSRERRVINGQTTAASSKRVSPSPPPHLSFHPRTTLGTAPLAELYCG